MILKNLPSAILSVMSCHCDVVSWFLCFKMIEAVFKSADKLYFLIIISEYERLVVLKKWTKILCPQNKTIWGFKKNEMKKQMRMKQKGLNWSKNSTSWLTRWGSSFIFKFLKPTKWGPRKQLSQHFNELIYNYN